MSISVICPACGEENSGGALLCGKCQASLTGVPRREKQAPQGVDGALGTFQASPIPNISSDPGYGVMFEKIRSWGVWSLILGALHIFTSGFLSAPWGILLIIVGLASFYFRSASMFVIYAVTLGWAALSNLLSLEPGWIGFSLYQFFLTFRVFQDYRLFRDLDANNGASDQSPDRAARFFPWIGSLLGCSSIIGFVLVMVIVVIVAVGSEGTSTVPDYFAFLEGLAVNFGILGAAIGLASLLSKYRLKPLAIIGLVAGTLTVLFEFALIYLL